jgi:hypothetical protein
MFFSSKKQKCNMLLMQSCVLSIFLLQFQTISGQFYSEESRRIKTRDGGFKYQNCGPASDPVKINTLSASPLPIALPNVFTISTTVSLNTNITAPLTVCLFFFCKSLNRVQHNHIDSLIILNL